ncbi:MAG: Ribonuclease [Planctomycetaceae bacterium]|nr:Ribonuclease [Planctomycetaceae bacterium]
MKITFLGAAGEVTGSSHLIECGKLRVLLDCGLFQGHREESRLKNQTFACRPDDLDAVILSHAHTDHCGNLPGLYKAGYRGPIFCTDATADVADLMMQDSAHIQEEDARYAMKRNPNAKPRIEPLYTLEHATAVTKLFEPLTYGSWHELAPDLRIRFRDAGHILGSAITELEFREKADIRRVVFTGDLGRRSLPVLRDPELIDDCEILITESTYANQIHPAPGDLKAALLRIVEEIAKTGGKVVIPAFALGRTQNVVYFLNELYNSGQLPRVPIYVDSPLSKKLTAVHSRYPEIMDENVQEMLLVDRDPFQFPGLNYIGNQQESMSLNDQKGPMVIIASSGMCESGRVVHHLKHTLSDPNNIILIIGYQAEYTLGRALVEKLPFIRIFGQEYPLRARVEKLNGLSAHADAEDFRWWLGHLGEQAGGVSQAFIVHGEEKSRQALAEILHNVCDHDPILPKRFESFEV